MRVLQAGEQLFNLNPGARQARSCDEQLYTEPAELPGPPNLMARFTEQLFCLYLLLPGTNPDSPGAWPAAPNNYTGFARPPGNPEARTRTICPDLQAQHAKKGPSSSPSLDTPNNSPILAPRIPASPRKRSYMPDYGFIYYLLLSQPHDLMLALRFSFFALPYA